MNSIDKKSRSDAITIGGLWLSVFSCDPGLDVTYGSGDLKYDSSKSYMTVTNHHLSRLGEYSSPVADYLHDDPSISLDYSQQDEESRDKMNDKKSVAAGITDNDINDTNKKDNSDKDYKSFF